MRVQNPPLRSNWGDISSKITIDASRKGGDAAQERKRRSQTTVRKHRHMRHENLSENAEPTWRPTKTSLLGAPADHNFRQLERLPNFQSHQDYNKKESDT